MNIRSESFKNAYFIFINPKKVPLFKDIIKRNNITEAEIFRATFDNTITMIALPNTGNIKETERLLFDQSNVEDGDVFWGQNEVGYVGKRWEKV